MASGKKKELPNKNRRDDVDDVKSPVTDEVREEKPLRDTQRPLEELERTLICKNLDVSTTKTELIDFLGLNAVNIDSIRFRSIPLDAKFTHNKLAGIVTKNYSEKTGAGKNAYVVLCNKQFISIAIQRNGEDFKKRHIFIDTVQTTDAKGIFDRMYTVFVGRLKMTDNEEKIFEQLAQFGKIKNLRLVRDPVTHESKKIAYVMYESKHSARLAIRHFKSMPKNSYHWNVTEVMKISDQGKYKESIETKKIEKRKALKDRHKGKQIFVSSSKNAKKRIRRAITSSK